jgi:hypothetical protein
MEDYSNYHLIRVMQEYVKGNGLSESDVSSIIDELKYAEDQHNLTAPITPINTYRSSYGATCGICPRCTKGVNSETDKFCHNCGARLIWS